MRDLDEGFIGGYLVLGGSHVKCRQLEVGPHSSSRNPSSSNTLVVCVGSVSHFCMDQRYNSGEEIHKGDRVEFNGCPAMILFVVDREEWPEEESEESRSWWRQEHGSGFLLLEDGGSRIFLPETDEDLIFISRGA